MMRLAFIDDPLVASLLRALLDRADRRAPEVRVKPPRVTLDAKSCPEWFTASGDAKSFSWRRIMDLEKAGLVGLPRQIDRLDAPWRERPSITLTIEGEHYLRDWMGRPFPEASAHKQWRAAVNARADLSGHLKDALLVRPILIGARDAASVLERLITASRTFRSSTKRRVVSAKAFWGMSKILDQRDDLLRTLDSQGGEVWPRRALLMHAHARVPVPSGILFVENLDAFDAVCAGDVPTPESWWILYAAGFKGSSQRLLNAGGVRWFTEAGTEQLPPSVLQQGLELAANGECEVAFWGDLDFAGMAILREIRRIIPSATAWAPGYERLVALLQGGHGHDPAESTKSGQQDPQVTGCPFSDKVLLPAMRDLRGFVDQEAVCHSDDWAQLTDRGNVANS